MERPKSSTSIVHGKGWLWLHFNLADRAPVTFWTPARIFLRRRALLVSVDEHQQLHGSDVCLYGIVADRGLDRHHRGGWLSTFCPDRDFIHF
jgi:hypothetical protein